MSKTLKMIKKAGRVDPLKGKGSVINECSLFSKQDIYLFKEGKHFRLYNLLGSHATEYQGVTGVYFALWAPNAKSVSVIGDFNGWNNTTHPLSARWDSSGIWEGFIPHIKDGEVYKYHLISKNNNYSVDKKDPFAFYDEIAPRTASQIWTDTYTWSDKEWMKERGVHNSLDAPMATYEMHLGSWRRNAQRGDDYLSYKELAVDLVKYIKEMGYTHLEFLPVMEHPFYGSWGYQTVGYFAPTSRYGPPEDFKYLVDQCHQNEISVILDWVPSHFPSDQHGLSYFDGTHLYEHADHRKGFHPDWKSQIFNYGRAEVREFLISNALFWLDKYHVDGLRVDAVASMLYLDYSRKYGEWLPNETGGNENVEAIEFLKELNANVYKNFPDVQMIAEESTAWSGVSRPVDHGGLGFGMKWNMGWMHDNLKYFAKDPIHRKYHHHELTFSYLYTFTENFVNALSHDEVVHEKGSLLSKMPGDDWQKFANLRLLYAYMYAHPGKKLLFMGCEFAQWDEWDHEKSLDWHLLEHAPHQGVQQLVKDLNALYKTNPALYQYDFSSEGFQWIDGDNSDQGVICFVRKGKDAKKSIVVVCNLTPETYHDYRIGVPHAGQWKELLNSDAKEYGGSGQGNLGVKKSDQIAWHGQINSVSLSIPPLGILFLSAKN